MDHPSELPDFNPTPEQVEVYQRRSQQLRDCKTQVEVTDAAKDMAADAKALPEMMLTDLRNMVHYRRACIDRGWA